MTEFVQFLFFHDWFYCSDVMFVLFVCNNTSLDRNWLPSFEYNLFCSKLKLLRFWQKFVLVRKEKVIFSGPSQT